MPVSKAAQRATEKWQKANYDKVLLRLPKGTKERISRHSSSVNGFIVEAVLEKLIAADQDATVRENAKTPEP